MNRTLRLSARAFLTHIAAILGAAAFVPAAAAAGDVEIVILHTTDLHGHIRPGIDYDGNPDQGGLARCAAAIRRIRAEETNVLLLDIGDTLQGTPASFLDRGKVMVDLLNRLDYDAWILGNHEFDWGWETLVQRIAECEPAILGANYGFGESVWPEEIRARVLPWILREVDGIRVAVVGLNTPGIPGWSRPYLLGGVSVEDPLECLERVLPEVRDADADVIVVAVHQGYRSWGDDHANRINAIADRFPEINLIIGAHTHQDCPDVVLHQARYTQAGYWGNRLGVARIRIDSQSKRVESVRCRTLTMGPGLPLDPEVMAIAAPALERAAAVADAVLGVAASDIGVDGWPAGPCPMFELIASSMADAADAEIVVHGLLNPSRPLTAGPVTMRDVWDVMPFENRLGVATITGTELREILEEQARWIESPRFNAPWGLRCLFAQEDGRVRLINCALADGTPIDPDHRYRVAFHSYAMAGAGDRFPRLREIVDRPSSRLDEENGALTREILADAIRARGTLEPQPSGSSWSIVQVDAPVPATGP